MSIFEQRANIKFCYLLKKSPAECLIMLNEAYGENSMKKTQVYFWFKRFKEGQTSIEDDERSGRPSTSTNDKNVELLQKFVRANRHVTCKELSLEFGISLGSVMSILHDKLNMKRLCQVWVPKLLSFDQKEDRKQIASDLLDKYNQDNQFIHHIIAGDETWCYLYDPHTKRESSEWRAPNSPKGKKMRIDRSKGKVLLEVFFDSKGIVHHEFIPEGETLNKEKYVEVLRKLKDAVRRKRPQFFKEKNWFLLHDNAPCHRAHIVQEYLTKHNIVPLPHPPYSPDLSPCDFFLFGHLKRALRGTRFTGAQDVRENTTKELFIIHKNGTLGAFQDLKKRWEKCIASEGDYFENE